MTDHRDLALETLAADEAALQARVAELEAERGSYRELLSVALKRLHDTSLILERTRASMRRLLDRERDHAQRPTQRRAA